MKIMQEKKTKNFSSVIEALVRQHVVGADDPLEATHEAIMALGIAVANVLSGAAEKRDRERFMAVYSESILGLAEALEGQRQRNSLN